MRELVQRVRMTETLLGSGEVAMAAIERDTAPLVRRSIAARHPLAAGHEVADSDLVWVRPGDGLPPGREHEVIGRTLMAPMATGDRFTTELLG